jgi:hypothetical protein
MRYGSQGIGCNSNRDGSQGTGRDRMRYVYKGTGGERQKGGSERAGDDRKRDGSQGTGGGRMSNGSEEALREVVSVTEILKYRGMLRMRINSLLYPV